MVQFALLLLLSAQAVLGTAAYAQTTAKPLDFHPGNPKQAAMLAKVPDAREIVAEPFSVAFVDLDGDGKNEIVLRSDSSAFCGSGGCLTVVLQQRGNQMATLLSQNLFPDIGVTDQKFGAYRALAALDGKGGIEIGDKPGTPLHGKRMVYPMLAQAAAAAPPAAPSASGSTDSTGTGPDIVGLRLGMSLEQIKAGFKAHAEDMKLREVLTVVNNAPSTEYLSVLSATNGRRHPVGPDDAIAVDFAPPPSPRRAIFLERFTGFPEAKRPLYSAVRAALIQKFGTPSHVQEGPDNYLVWANDRNGNRITGKNALRCGKYAPGDPSRRNFTVLFGGIKPTGCGLTVFAKLGRAQLRGAPGIQLTELAEYLSVSIVDDSEFDALREAAAQAAADETRRKGAAVAVPKI
jgi:hypothetical protein